MPIDGSGVADSEHTYLFLLIGVALGGDEEDGRGSNETKPLQRDEQARRKCPVFLQKLQRNGIP